LDFFVYSRDAGGTEALRANDDLLEQHWSYMDAFAESMIARGPTFHADRETVSGSLHVLGLPNIDAARTFVAREPNNRAGVYGEHLVWRFENLLGRTMWEFPNTADDPKFPCHRPFPMQASPAEKPAGRVAGVADPLRCPERARRRRPSGLERAFRLSSGFELRPSWKAKPQASKSTQSRSPLEFAPVDKLTEAEA
jgi:uncharacterized protein YciI